MAIVIATIGFAGSTAESFFRRLSDAKITCLIDVRLRPDSQLSGFAKARDLAFFLRRLNTCAYQHVPVLAPTADLLDTYRHHKDWDVYEHAYLELLADRSAATQLDMSEWIDRRSCLLCSENKPDHCHRRLAAEFLAANWLNVEILHL